MLTVPSAPLSLAASGGNGQNGVAWNPPASTGGAAITSYRLFRGTSSSNRQQVTSGGCANLGLALGCTDTGLTNGQSYNYVVAAVNSVGQGANSTAATATPVALASIPSAPQFLSAVGGNGLNGLGWAAPASPGSTAITSYRVFRGTNASNRQLVTSGGCANLGGSAGSCTDTGLTNGQSYDYIVSAVNSIGQGPPSNSAVAMPSGPTIPVTLLVDGGTSSARQIGQTFTFTGANYTPNRTVTRFLRTPSGTTSTLAPTLTASASGILSWSFTPTCGNPLGAFIVWAVDDATGRQSAAVTQTISQSATCGALSLSVSPSSGTQLSTTFTVTGSALSPNGMVKRFVQQPGWGGFREIDAVQASGDGRISWTYLPDCSNAPGDTLIYVVDTVTGRQSETIVEKIAASPQCQTPALTITPSDGTQQSTQFVINGQAFTSLGRVRLFVKRAGSTSFIEGTPVFASSVGSINWSFTPDCNYSIGTAQMYALDDNTNRVTLPISYMVRANSSCAGLRITAITPPETPRGAVATLSLSGSGFVNGFTAWLISSTGEYPIQDKLFISSTQVQVAAFLTGGAAESMRIRIVNPDGASAEHAFSATAAGDAAAFVSDVTTDGAISNDVQLDPHTPFKKTWRLRNTGGTTWTTGYSIGAISTERMGAPLLVQLPSAVSPGQSIDISVQMTAPSQAGTIQSLWRLTSPNGQRFGPQVVARIVVAASAPPPPKIKTWVAHGWQPPFADAPDWVDAVVRKIDETAQDAPNRLGSEGFYWTRQSNNDGAFWAAAAGDHLFAKVATDLRAMQPHSPADVKVHLIGHSLGGSVVSQAAGRLIGRGFGVRQVTFLEAVASYQRARFFQWSNPAIKSWSGIDRIDNYVGTGLYYGCDIFPHAMPYVYPTLPNNTSHTSFYGDYSHDGDCSNNGAIHRFYLDSIKAADAYGTDDKDGWYWSPFGPGADTPLPDVTPSVAKTPFPVAPTIFNGDFCIHQGKDKSSHGNWPGYEWTEGRDDVRSGFGDGVTLQARGDVANEWAAKFTSSCAVQISNGTCVSLTKPTLSHAPTYIPDGFDRITFDYKLTSRGFGEPDNFEVSLDDTRLNCGTLTTGDWTQATCSTSGFVGKSPVIKIAFTTGKPALGSLVSSVGWVDNLSLASPTHTGVVACSVFLGAGTTSSASMVGLSSAAADDATAATTLTQTLNVTVPGSSFDSWTLVPTDPWVTIVPTTLSGGGGPVTVSIDTSGLPPGLVQSQVSIVPTGWIGTANDGGAIAVQLSVNVPELGKGTGGSDVLFGDLTAVTYHFVTTSGATAQTLSSPQNVQLPSRMFLPQEALVHDLATAAVFGTATLRLPFDRGMIPPGSEAVLLRIAGNAAVRLAARTDYANGFITAEVSTLGRYVVGITQNGGCDFSLSEEVHAALPKGNKILVSVHTADPSCTWTATSSSPFAVVTGDGDSHTGSGAVTISVLPNTGAARIASVEIAGVVVTIGQATGEAPANLFVNQSGNGRAVLSWSAVPEAIGYIVKRGNSSGAETALASDVSGTTYLDATVAAGSVYYYVVAAVNAGGEGVNSSEVTFVPFTDDPLVARVTPARAAHVSELRYHINVLRARHGLTGFVWTDPTIVAGVTVMRAVHLAELKTALDAVYVAAGRVPPAYSSSVSIGLVIDVTQLTEIRTAIRAIY